MQCLPDNLRDRVYYHPTNEGIEKRIRERMEEIKRQRSRGVGAGGLSKRKNRNSTCGIFTDISYSVARPVYGYDSQLGRRRNLLRQSCPPSSSTTCSALQKAAQKITSILDLDQLIDSVVHEVTQSFRMPRSQHLTCTTKNAARWSYAGVHGCTLHGKGHRLKIGREGMVGYVASTGQTRYAPDVRKDSTTLRANIRRARRWRFLCASASELVGVFTASHPEDRRISASAAPASAGILRSRCGGG